MYSTLGFQSHKKLKKLSLDFLMSIFSGMKTFRKLIFEIDNVKNRSNVEIMKILRTRLPGTKV